VQSRTPILIPPMTTNGILRKHCSTYPSISPDSVLYYAAALAAVLIRSAADFNLAVADFWPYMMLTAFVFRRRRTSSVFTPPHSGSQGVGARAGILAVCTLFAVSLFVAGTYLHSFRPIGRGAVGILAASPIPRR